MMDHRFLVQRSLKSWECEPETSACPFCEEFLDGDYTYNSGCGECPLVVRGSKSCLTMVLGGFTYYEDSLDPAYIQGCIAFYREWLETGVMPHVEYREG